MMQMALSNAVHPEYGVVTIPFPIPEEEYGHCLELLEALEIGNAVSRDCKVQEVQDGPPILKRLAFRRARAKTPTWESTSQPPWSGAIRERTSPTRRPSWPA